MELQTWLNPLFTDALTLDGMDHPHIGNVGMLTGEIRDPNGVPIPDVHISTSGSHGSLPTADRVGRFEIPMVWCADGMTH